MLVAYEVRYPEELRADLQQYYGLNLDGMGVDYSYSHAAILVKQLPQSSRLYRVSDSNYRWSEEAWLLWHIEHDLRVLAWQQTKDAQKKRNYPDPLKTPKELEEEQHKLDNFDKSLIDEVLGLEGVNNGG